MIPLIYQEEYSKKSFFDLASAFGTPGADSTIRLDHAAGHGTIQVLDIENGLQIRIWDCTFSSQLSIDRQPSIGDNDKSFTLVYYMTPGSFVIKNENSSANCLSKVWNTAFMTSDAGFKVNILPGKPLQCLSLNFTPAWLEKNILCDGSFQDQFFQQKVMSSNPFLCFESSTINEDLVIDNLFRNKFQQSFGKFFFRSKALNLLTEFFIKMSTRVSSRRGTLLYHEKQVADAEKRLMANLNNGLPDIGDLAGELSMSESTLKRYFKKIYGKNIYEYFLEKKMMHARQLLVDKNQSVTEVAYTVGYEKVSQFISMFKRHYGIQPGAYKQSYALSSVA